MSAPPEVAPLAARPITRWLPWLRWAGAVLSLLIFVASGVAWAMYKNFTGDVRTGGAVPADATDADGAAENILLVGNDTRDGATPAELNALHVGPNEGTVNADTMMVLHIPGNGGRPSLVSFPRDSWVTIPGHGQNKLNAAYPIAYNAAKAAGRTEVQAESARLLLTIATIHALTGLHIDHYVQVNLLGFYRISKAIGGITVCLNAAQNASTDRDEFGSGYSGIDLPKGVSTIEGDQALAFVRQRHGLPHGDLDRIRRQQYFLSAAFDKIASAGVLLNPFKLNKLLHAVGSSLLIDPGLDLTSLAQQFMSLTSGRITFTTLPNTGPQLIYPDGVETAIVGVDRAAIPDFLRGLDGQAPTLAKIAAAAPGDTTVDVLNGTDTPRLAAKNADQLIALHFKVNTVGSTDQTPLTTIVYPARDAAQARALLAAVRGARTVQSDTVSRVTLRLGSNGVQVRGLAAASHPVPANEAAATSSSSPSSTAAKPADPTRGLGCID
ncbi:MAG: LCP family protein [Jatrophihabitans sp.]|uniref:LCP family protein n=1 Tax=Jatrophihabitans sp. TaxID=1932789 RepID=UPI003F7ED555